MNDYTEFLRTMKIGDEFLFLFDRWRCTDVGSRTLVAFKLHFDAPVYRYKGPPYIYVEEKVFTEYDLIGCAKL